MAADERQQRLAALRRVAARQRMLVATRQLDAIGLGPSGRRNAVRHGDLVRRRRGVYALPGAGVAWEDDVLAAVLAAGPGAVASFDTARRLWLPPDPPAPAPPPIELTGPRQVECPGVAWHRRPLPAEEVTSRAGIPVTTVSRTLLDLATRLDPDRLGALADQALRTRVVSLRELGRVATSPGPGSRRARPGASRLLAVVEDRRSSGGPGGSAWEEQMDRAWDRMGLPPAVRQYWIDTPQGRYCVDRAIVASKIAVEWNGYEYHGQRSRFDRDSDRRGHLAAVGWLVLDFTSRSSLEHIRRTVLAAVAQRPAALRSGAATARSGS